MTKHSLLALATTTFVAISAHAAVNINVDTAHYTDFSPSGLATVSSVQKAAQTWSTVFQDAKTQSGQDLNLTIYLLNGYDDYSPNLDMILHAHALDWSLGILETTGGLTHNVAASQPLSLNQGTAIISGMDNSSLYDLDTMSLKLVGNFIGLPNNLTSSSFSHNGITYSTSGGFLADIALNFSHEGRLITGGVLNGASTPGVRQNLTTLDIDYVARGANLQGTFNYNPSAIPEPSTYGLMGAGVMGTIVAIRRRKKASLMKK